MDLSLHDATLDEVAVEWHTRVCIVRLRRVGPDGGQPVELRWHGVTEFQMTSEAPWGASASVLEARSLPGGTDELALQSGDVLRVRAEGLHVTEAPEPLEGRYGSLIADALVSAGVVEKAAYDRAAAIAADEIRARRGVGDV
jgi:hypothetical protein